MSDSDTDEDVVVDDACVGSPGSEELSKEKRLKGS